MFNWYSTSRLVAVISWLEQQLGADNPGDRWRWALLHFAYRNVGFDLKQLIEVLCCDLQVTIHEGLAKSRMTSLKQLPTSSTTSTS